MCRNIRTLSNFESPATDDEIEIRAGEAGVIEALGVTNGSWAEQATLLLSTVNPQAVRFRASALQFVRKISGTTKPSKANEELFQQAVEDVTAVARRLVDHFVTNAPPRNREIEAAKARARAQERYGS